MENDAKAQKMRQERRKRCKGMKNEAKVRKMMQGHGKQCEGVENDVKARKTMQRRGAKPKQELGSMHGGGNRHKKQ